MNTQPLQQTVVLPAPPARVFKALTRSKDHSAFTGAPADVNGSPGRPFSAYGSYISGVTLFVRKNQALVQSWRGSDWPKGEISLLRLELKASGKTRTRVTLTQLGVPKAHMADIAKGWHEFYWKPLNRWLSPKPRRGRA